MFAVRNRVKSRANEEEGMTLRLLFDAQSVLEALVDRVPDDFNPDSFKLDLDKVQHRAPPASG